MATSSSERDNAAPVENGVFKLLSILGSLWIAAVLLMLLLVAMACATVFESRHSLPHAKAVFYNSWWFLALLGLFAVNVFCSILVRFPITRKRIGFLLTHAGLLIVVVGAVMTGEFGIDGVLPITEGDSATEYRVSEDVLALTDRRDSTATTLELPSPIGKYETIENPNVPVLARDNVRIQVTKYLPDSQSAQVVVDDNPRAAPAVEVAWNSHGQVVFEWLFKGRKTQLGNREAIYRQFDSADKLADALAEEIAVEATSFGSIHIEINGKAHDIAIEACTGDPVPVGDTEYAVHLVRYLPHATVGPDKKLTNASQRPENPAVQIELTGPMGVQKRNCFAKFPDFQTVSGPNADDDLKVTFIATAAAAPEAPVEVLGGPDGALHVRFSGPQIDGTPKKATLGEAIEMPWHHETLTVTKRFQNARVDQAMKAVTPPRENRVQAIEVKIDSGEHTSTMWLQRGFPRSLSIDGQPYQILYGDKVGALGFTLKLNDFRIITYPGGGQPRSFESDVTITDSATGAVQSTTVSMNHPVKYGGFTLFQSSYQMGRGKAMSVLSVSRDPGLPVVFAGYIICFVGMLWVLVSRIREGRRIARLLAMQEKI